MTHVPFPIADYESGIDLAREPWLSPSNAFQRVENARVRRGRITQRDAFRYHSELASGTTIKTYAPGAPTALGNVDLEFDYVWIAVPDLTISPRQIPCLKTVDIYIDNGVGGGNIHASIDVDSMKWTPKLTSNDPDYDRFQLWDAWRGNMVATGTNTVIGYCYLRSPVGLGNTADRFYAVVWFREHPGWVQFNAQTWTFKYWPNPLSAVVGLRTFRISAGSYIAAMDQDYVYKYDPTEVCFKKQGFTGTFAGPFTGTDENYFWTWPIDQGLLITNGVNPVCLFDPLAVATASVSEMATNFDGGGSNLINTAALVVHFRGRVIYIGTTESGASRPGRMRWTASGSLSAFDSPLYFDDAPAKLGAAITAEVIGNRLFVGFEAGWAEVEYTGDPAQVFKWAPHISRFGAVSKLSSIPDGEKILSRSDTSMQVVDPNGQYYLDEKFPDLVKTWNQSKKHLCAAVRNEDRRGFWWTYVGNGQTRPENLLVATYNEAGQLAWSNYTVPLNVMTFFESDLGPVWDSYGLPWDSYDDPWDLAGGSIGKKQLLAGREYGQIVVTDAGFEDYLFPRLTTEVNMLVQTQQLAPYPMSRAHLGWVDVYATAVSEGTLEVGFYADDDRTRYLVEVIDLTAQGQSNKVYRRIPVQRTATFHRIEITTRGCPTFSLDAIIPWFRKAGRARAFG